MIAKKYAILTGDTIGLCRYLQANNHIIAVLHPASELFEIVLTEEELLILKLVSPITDVREI